MDELNASTKFGSVEKSRLETEITTLQRRLRMEQELTKRAEADLAAKSREADASKFQDGEILRSKVAALLGQKEKLELASKDWQSKHADISSRLNQCESQKSRALLECEDLVFFTFADLANYRIMNLSDLNRLAIRPSGWP